VAEIQAISRARYPKLRMAERSKQCFGIALWMSPIEKSGNWNSLPYVSMSFPAFWVLSSSIDDIEDREDDEGDWRGLSFGEAAAVDGEESKVFEVTVRRRSARFGNAVEAIVTRVWGRAEQVDIIRRLDLNITRGRSLVYSALSESRTMQRVFVEVFLLATGPQV
jgi:hypothetical protein